MARYLFRKVVSWGRSSNVFLTNGSRLYLDVGSHPEYATAECDDVAQLIAHDRAGQLILDDLVREAQSRLELEGFDGKVYLFKNNTDSAGNSYGSHENYLIPRRGEFTRLAEILIPFLVTRQLIAGAGKVLSTPQGALYAFSQRADHIWEGVSSATTRSRPIINTRDEPHADAEFYRRLHVIVGDSNMSETTTMLKVGTVDLLLRMVEEGVIMRDMRMENPIRSIREISHDLTGRPLVQAGERPGADGPADPARISRQGRRLRGPQRGAQPARAEDHGPVGAHPGRRSRRRTTAASTPRWTGRSRRNCSTATGARHGLDLDSPRMAQLDLTYHDISPTRGLFNLLESRGATAPGGGRRRREGRRGPPPQTTRAKLRGDFVRRPQERAGTTRWTGCT